MTKHNQFKRISTTPQANTIPYADENGYISNWLDNDPIITSLRQLPLATASTVGVVKPDGSTITIDSNGVITATGGGTGTTFSFPLFYPTFADHLFNNANWLRADTFSWQSGAVYVSAYNHLVNDLITNVETLYCWNRPSKEVYTIEENPSIGDNVYIINNGIVEFASTIDNISGNTIYPSNMQAYTRYSSGDINNQEVPITSETETVAGTTITFYRADDGHKIVLADQESNVSAIYTATGIAWYHILDTTNQRFKLPRSQWNFVGLRDNVGNYVSESLPNIYTEIATRKYESGVGPVASVTGAGTFENDGYTAASNIYTAENRTSSYSLQKSTIDASVSSSVYQNGAPVQQRATQMYLYFYVGNIVQDQTTIDVGEIMEELNGKADIDLGNCTKPYITETYVNGTSWYRIWSDGWCEQGGESSPATQIVLLKAFNDTNYTITGCPNGGTASNSASYMAFYNKTATGFYVTTSENRYSVSWEAKGYII